MKIAVIGGVESTSVLIDKLHEHEFEEVKIWAYKPKKLSNVSGWKDLSLLAKEYKFKYSFFSKVDICETDIKNFMPDYIFVVGLSQIIPENILKIARYGCIGFHPTALPKGRGRAPIAWLILEREKIGASTFFFMENDVDNGSIIEQVKFNVDDDDDAASVVKKLLEAQKLALDNLLSKIQSHNEIISIKQDVKLATWFGKRNPDDGLINWHESASSIEKLIRASSSPHPGAFTFFEHETIKIWEAKKVDAAIKGVIGRVLEVNKLGSFIVQTGDGLIEVLKWSHKKWFPKVGMSLGYTSQIEINNIYKEFLVLKNRILKIEKKITELDNLE